MTEASRIRPDSIPDAEAFATFARAGVAMVLTDPHLPDHPIVYVNDAFERTTGYARSAAVGRNCRFLQGEGTDPDHRRALREGIAAGREVSVDILNYRADGTPFRNRLLVTPIRGPDGSITHYLGIQKEMTPDPSHIGDVSVEDALREIQHRVKNHLAMIVSLIRVQSRREGMGGLDGLARRVESLQLLYEELNHAGRLGRGESVSLAAYLGRVCNALGHLEGRPGVRMGIDMTPVDASVETAARIGLILSEVVTNALEHAFEAEGDGSLQVTLRPLPAGGARLEVVDDGGGFPPGVTWPEMASVGGRIVASLAQGMNARLDVASGPSGTRVTLDVPGPIDQK